MSGPVLQPRLAAILHADVADSTKLVQLDERATHSRVQAAFGQMADCVAEHGGVLHEIRGDAALAEFSRVSDAVSAAVATQEANQQRNATFRDNIRPRLRIGISLGEIVVADGTMTGAGVVLAQRLEQLAEPDGVCIQGSVYETVPRRLPFVYSALGEQTLKGFTEPVRAYYVARREGIHQSDSGACLQSKGALEQEIRFCSTSDGVSIAYATVGEGAPLVKTGNWMNHLEFDWQSPVWRHMFERLSDERLLVRYDPRGTGLSDWDVDRFSFDGWIQDLETVVDAANLEQFALLGVSQGCAIAVAYAVRHPERLTHLILHAGFARSPGVMPETQEFKKWNALAALVRHGWGQNNPAFRQMFTSMFMPNATAEEMQWFNELQATSMSPRNAVRFLAALGDVDVAGLLEQVKAPTLVLHSRGDAVVPLELGRELAKIPGARFVLLEGSNHLLVEHEPAWIRFVSEVRGFLAEVTPGS